jgi:hypothetical protein
MGNVDDQHSLKLSTKVLLFANFEFLLQNLHYGTNHMFIIMNLVLLGYSH